MRYCRSEDIGAANVVFNGVYVEAFETILMIEKTLGRN
jgi:hypothetical protein